MRPHPRAAKTWWPRPSLWVLPAKQRACLPAPWPQFAHRPSVPPWPLLWFVCCPPCRSRSKWAVGLRAPVGVQSPHRHWLAPAVELPQMQTMAQVQLLKLKARWPNAFGALVWPWAVAQGLGVLTQGATTGFAPGPPAWTAALEFAKRLRPPSPAPPPHAEPKPPKSNATKSLVSGHCPGDADLKAWVQPGTW